MGAFFLFMIPNCKLELRPSLIHGVGVFAVQQIAQGEFPFIRDNTDFTLISKEEFTALNGPMKQLVTKYSVWLDDGSYFIDADLRKPEISMYLNHSDNPNLDSKTFCALRDIWPDEELTIDYNGFDRDQSIADAWCR
jgi:SET domain-containing protein